MNSFPHSINKLIDHTILKPDAKKSEIKKLVEEAISNDFMSICINPYWVSYASELLKESTVKICTVIGFPLGANTSEVKAFEAKQALKDGATEVDMVINIGALKEMEYDVVLKDIKSVVEAVASEAIVKVIIETALLTEDEKRRASELSKEAGADFVKTSTGFSTAGATVDDVKLMRSAVGKDLGVKASGGVKTITDVEQLMEAGATRIGTSSGIDIVNAVKQ